MKRTMCITIDSDVWLHYRMKNDFNLSKHINEILKFQMQLKNDVDIEEKELIDRINEIKDQRERLDEEMIKLQSTIMHVQKQKEENQKLRDQEIDFVHKTIISSGMMKDLI